jgi:hypothetical protein
MNRRKFLKYTSALTVLLANGKILSAVDLARGEWPRGKVTLRFAVASDGHYGQPGTPYEKYHETLVERINAEHLADPFAFCVINGDIIHDDKEYYPAVKKSLDGLNLKYYVSQGNHDHVTPGEWESIWNMPVNVDFAIDDNAFLIATTSNEKGKYLCPDINWMANKLAQYHQQKNVFIFVHINPAKQTKNAVDCPELFDVFSKHKNVRAVFNGHDHDEEGIKTKNEIPFIFDAHFGGNWGTAYRGFRVVELMDDNSILTYILNPLEKINEAVLST